MNNSYQIIIYMEQSLISQTEEKMRGATINVNMKLTKRFNGDFLLVDKFRCVIEKKNIHYFFYVICKMSNSPVITPRQSQTEILTDVQTSTPIDAPALIETNDQPDLFKADDQPVLIKADDRTSSITSHIDENNENEAVSALVTSFAGDQTEYKTT